MTQPEFEAHREPALPGRRRLLQATAMLPLVAAAPSWSQTTASNCLSVSDWTTFATRHIQADGRVVDFDTPQQQSTSEGQSYGLFFALVHNDRPTFNRVLEWTHKNLADGDLAKRLPAWQWGKKPEGGWGVLDNNSAADSDLWISYTLIEAARLWKDPSLQKLGRAMLAMVVKDEVIKLPGLGQILLPWPRSVATGPAWRLNPSYLPLQLLRRLAEDSPGGPWNEIAQNTVRMLGAVSPLGYVPDWCAWSEDEKTFVPDPKKPNTGGYDAIRVYLWAGMLHRQDPARALLLKTLYGPRRAIEQQTMPPEYVDTATGAMRGTGGLGFAGALLPYLKAQNLTSAVDVQTTRVRNGLAISATPGATAPLPYYERMLILFGLSWLEGRYAFSKSGQLQPNWRLLCPPDRPA
ncbi:cellulose synthase complex periplasmic endoglucanase BcsZ [soil metagenome]